MFVRTMVDHVSQRAIGFASTAACVIVGFAVATAVVGAFYYFWAFLFLSLYFFAFAEIAANPLFGPGNSRLCPFAFGVIIAMPFSAHLLV